MTMRFLAAASLSLSLLAAPAFADELKAVRTITVTGEAKKQVVPDEAHLTVNLNAQNKDMAAAQSAHNQKLSKLMAIVKKAGIDEKKVRTQSSNIQPVYTSKDVAVPVDTACMKAYEEKLKKLTSTPGSILTPCPGGYERKSVLEGYRVQTDLDVTVGDTKKLAALMDKIATSGFEQDMKDEWGNLMSVYYTLSDPDKLRDEMLSEAIANAKAKAERMASAAGSGLGRVYSINEGGTPQFQPVMMAAPRAMMMKAGIASDAAMAPPAGEQQVQSSVTVTYELK